MKHMEEIEALLLEKGFDVEQALEICAEDWELYTEVLHTALEEGERKLPIIKKSLAGKDYERYHIEVHALKNAMRAIGAAELSQLSYEQEMAVKNKEYEKIEADSLLLIKKYEDTLDILHTVFE